MTHFRAYKNVSECLAKANVVGEGGTEMVKNGRFGYLPMCLWWTRFLGYWKEAAWVSASSQAIQETGLDEAVFPESCTWTTEQILNQDFLPD
jgi:hypothetical protein